MRVKVALEGKDADGHGRRSSFVVGRSSLANPHRKARSVTVGR